MDSEPIPCSCCGELLEVEAERTEGPCFDCQAEAAGCAIAVKDADDCRKAGTFFTSIKIKNAETARPQRVKPLNETVKLINADFMAITDQLEAILRAVEALLQRVAKLFSASCSPRMDGSAPSVACRVRARRTLPHDCH